MQLLADAFLGLEAHPDDLALARRLLSHDAAEHIIAGLLRDHLGARPEAVEQASAARHARRRRLLQSLVPNARSAARNRTSQRYAATSPIAATSPDRSRHHLMSSPKGPLPNPRAHPIDASREPRRARVKREKPSRPAEQDDSELRVTVGGRATSRAERSDLRRDLREPRASRRRERIRLSAGAHRTRPHFSRRNG